MPKEFEMYKYLLNVVPLFLTTLTELNEQFAIASPLVGRQGQDAGNVIIFSRLFLLHTEHKN